MKNKSRPIENYRSSVDERLTGRQQDEYINGMGEIQQRLLEIKSQLNSEIVHNIQNTVKLVYLYFREITELLIDCLLIIRNTREQSIDMSRKTRTRKKIKYLKEQQKAPYFIPLELSKETGNVFRSILDGKLYVTREGGIIALPHTISLNRKDKGYLTLNDLETLYDKANSVLHATPRFSEGSDHNEYITSAKGWYNKIEELIELHSLITETDKEKDRRIYLYRHRSAEDGQSHFYLCEPQNPGSDWTYNPKTQ